MMLADSNVWLAVALSKHEFHDVASGWLAARQLSDRGLLCRSTQNTFLRLLTTRAVLAPYKIPPLSNDAAWLAYERFMADDRVGWSEEPTGLESHWKSFAATGKASPKLWMDAYLAAFAVAGGHKLVTTDAAFKQFKGLDLLVLSKT